MHVPSAELDFRHVVELLADAVVAARGEEIVYVNAAAERLLGWSREELVGRSLVTIVPERLRAAHLAGIARYRATHVPKLLGKPVRVPALRRDGVEIDIELTITAYVVDGDDLFVASLRDLRDRVELERQLEVGDQLRMATRAAAALASQVDLDHVVATTVSTLVDGFGAALGRLWLASALSDGSDGSSPVPTTLHLRGSAGLSTRIDGSRATIDVATYPYKVGEVARTRTPFVKNGLEGDPQFDAAWVARERLRAVAAFPLLVGAELRGVIAAFFRDPLSEEQIDLLGTFSSVVSAVVNDMILLDQLHAAVDARDHFLSMASHELNTPITTLRLQIEAMMRGGPSSPQWSDRLSRVQKQVTRLAFLVRELLDVSQIAEGRLRFSVEEIDLGQLVLEVADLHSVDLENAGCSIELDGAPGVVGLWDRDRLDQVVTNLIGNAVKYGAGKPIRIEIARVGDVARLVVRDQGMGIAPKDQTRIFQRFERATRGGKQAGLGLGLWIVEEIVRAHGGSIRVESEIGHGATFVVELPARV